VVQKTQNAVILLLGCCLLTGACQPKSKLATVDVNAVELPLTHAEDVVSLISDSGVTRYRLTTKVWDDYAEYTLFPEGIYIEQFDESLHIVSSVKADTAYHYHEKDLIRLIGNVDIQNPAGDRFETSELYWNRLAPPNSHEAIYTDSFIKITRNGDLTTAYGFKSNSSMDDYTMYKNSFEIAEEKMEKKAEKEPE
jgi:LPS export ABC transporter protein LptC